MNRLINTILQSDLIAQVQFEELAQEGTSKIMVLALVICIGGIVAGGFQLMKGEITHAIYILVGSLVIGGAVPIATAFFDAAGVS